MQTNYKWSLLLLLSLQVRQTSKYEDLRELDLPKNLHIQQEYIWFSPEDKEAYHGGWTAYPGRNTVVTSIKCKKKYGHYNEERKTQIY